MGTGASRSIDMSAMVRHTDTWMETGKKSWRLRGEEKSVSNLEVFFFFSDLSLMLLPRRRMSVCTVCFDDSYPTQLCLHCLVCRHKNQESIVSTSPKVNNNNVEVK